MDYSHLMRTPEQVDELFPWMREDLIRGIPHFISPAWNHDRSQFDPDYWADCWANMGCKSVTLLTGHHDGYLLYPSKYMKQQPDRDYFGEQVRACRERGMRVIAYYSLTLDSLVGSEHPDWRAKDMAGRVYPPNYEYFSHYHWLCLNSPYRDFVVNQLEEVVDNYEVEGAWIDILYLPGHTEELERDTCFCEYCHRQYSDWFKGEHLLDAAGTPRHNEFRAMTYRNFLAQLKTMLMGKERPLALTFNGAGRRRMPGYKICDDLTDFYSGEAHNPTSLMITSKSHRGTGRAFELLSCSEVCWSHNQLKPDTLITLESLSTLIAGGTYTIGVTHAPDGRLSAANVERLARWGKWIHERGDLFRKSEPVYEAGILAPELGPTGIEKWAEWLRKGHLLFDVFMDLPEGRALPKVVLVPAARPLSEDEARRLKAYVEQGGKVMLEYPAEALREHRPWMEELVGARMLREHGQYAFYLQPLSGAGAGEPPALLGNEGLAADLPEGDPVMVYAKAAGEVELTGAEVLAELVFQFKDKVRTSDIQTVANFWAREGVLPRPPGIIINRIGKGCVVTTMVGLTVHNRDEDRCPWPEMLAQNCLRYLLGEQMVRVGDYNEVEVNLARQEGRQVLHFVNHMYGAGMFMHGRGETQYLRELPVKLGEGLRGQVKRAVLEPEGVELEVTEEGFVLPKLGVYQAVGLYS
ncbi:MAG: alpha-amylase family protein [Armatimonadia bacterium]